MSKNNIILLAVVVILVIGLGFWKSNMKKANAYSIVYLTTGEVYIGKLTTFPDFQLKDSYILQLNKDATDPTKNNFQLQPINEALWAPEVLHVNRKNVVFYGPILPNSKIAQALVAKGK